MADGCKKQNHDSFQSSYLFTLEKKSTIRVARSDSSQARREKRLLPLAPSLFQALGQWGLSNAAGLHATSGVWFRKRKARPPFFSPDPACPTPAFDRPH